MKQTVKGYLLGFLSAALLLSSAAYAINQTKSINVTYRNIKVYKDNVLCELKDANGTTVEPFIYNGTTYLPVRGTANAAGMDVTWDGATSSVYLWDKMTANDTYLLDVIKPYETNGFDLILSSEGKSFEMAGKKYSNGISVEHNGYALFNLDAKNSTLNCVIGHTAYNTQSKTVSFVIDGKTVKTVELEPECMPKTISVPLNYGLQMKILVDNGLIGYGNSFSAKVGIANMIVK